VTLPNPDAKDVKCLSYYPGAGLFSLAIFIFNVGSLITAEILFECTIDLAFSGS